jgi:LuxR family maltose regulon positive regulatory protein
MKTKVLLVDDHPIFRKGLNLLFKGEKDIRVIGEAEDGQTAIEMVRKLSPDVVVMDITMPDLNGIEACRHIVAESPDTRVMAMSIHSGRRFVENMMEAGAAGYILKESAPEELVNGIRAVMDGKAYMSPSIKKVALPGNRKAHARASAPEEKTGLTAQEQDLIQLLLDGNTTEQIASVLQVSTKKVNSMQKQLMKKL